jgi:HPt (histidine-containing phosphotransfer) domain-containing protein
LRRDARWRELPVIAVTAGIFESMKEEALAAGMNDFIAKPMEPEQLIACIQRWTGRPRTGAPPMGDSDVALLAGMGRTPDTIDLPAALARWGDSALYRTYLRKFAEAHAEDAQAIAAAIQTEAFAEGAALAHRLAGVAATLAMPRLADLARNLEQDMLGGQAPAAALETEFQTTFAEVLKHLRAWISEEEPPERPSAANEGLDQDAKYRLLASCRQALDEQDLDHVEACLEQLQGSIPEKTLAAVRNSLSEFDFRGAERVLRGLIEEP